MSDKFVTGYSIIEMLEVLRTNQKPTTFLRDKLVKRTREHVTSYIQIDVTKNGLTLPAYVSPIGDAEVVNKPGFDSKVHTLPYTKQKMILRPSDLNTRLPGETIYSTSNPGSRLDVLMGEYLAILDQRLEVLEEKQIADALMYGTCVVAGDGVAFTVDYGRDEDNDDQLTGNDRWSQSATRDILGDMRNAATQMIKIGVGGGYPDLLLLGTNAAGFFMDEALTADTKLNKALDVRRFEGTNINLRLLQDQKVTYLGHVTDVGISIDVYEYHGAYQVDGVDTPFIDPDMAVFINTAARVERHYAMIENFNGNFIGQRFPQNWIVDDGSAMVLQLESGPLVANHEPNATYALTVDADA